MAEENKLDFWKAAKEARSITKEWPEWKRNVRLTEYSTGLGKSVSKKEETMTEFYTISECFEACGDDDFPYEAEHDFNCRGEMYTKKQLLELLEYDMRLPSIRCSASKKWQIKRAEREVFTDKYKAYEKYTGGNKALDHYKDGWVDGFEYGDKNGQLWRDIVYRPLVESIESIKDFLDAWSDKNTDLKRIVEALENIPPLDEQ